MKRANISRYGHPIQATECITKDKRRLPFDYCGPAPVSHHQPDYVGSGYIVVIDGKARSFNEIHHFYKHENPKEI